MAQQVRGIPSNTALIDTVFDRKTSQRVTIIYFEERTIWHCTKEHRGYLNDIKAWIADELEKYEGRITTIVPAPRGEKFFKQGMTLNDTTYNRSAFSSRSYDLLEVYTMQVVKGISAGIEAAKRQKEANNG